MASAKALRRAGVLDQRPGHHLHLHGRAGPLHHGDRDRAGRAAADGVEHLLAAERIRIAAPLQFEARLVDAARGIDRQHQKNVGRRQRLGLRRGRRDQGEPDDGDGDEFRHRRTACAIWRGGPEVAGVGDQRVAHRVGLLDDHGMGRIRNDHDGDAVAQRAPVFLGVLHMGQRIVARLDIEHRRLARRVVDRSRRQIAGDALGGQHLGMPAVEPDAGVAARREEHELHRLDALVVRRRRVRAHADRGPHVRRARIVPDIGGDKADGAHELGPRGRQHPRHAVAEGVADHEGRPVVVVLDHRGDVGREIFQLDALPRPGALPDAARLRPQHAKACVRETFRDGIEIGRAAAERRQQHDRRAFALRQHFEAGVAARHHDVLHGVHVSAGAGRPPGRPA